VNDAFFAGALAAWAVTYCSVALLFMLANLWARREREYLMFGLFVLALAVMNAGIALVFQPEGAPAGLVGNRIAVSGGLLAALFQLQFAVFFSGRARPWGVWLSSLATLGLVVWTWSVPWDVPPALEGERSVFLRMSPGLGVAFCVSTLVSLVVTLCHLSLSWRNG